VKSDAAYKLPWWHYAPIMIYTGIFIYLNAISEPAKAKLYQAGYLYWIFNVFEGLAIMLNIVYLTKNFVLLKRYRFE